jgi:hypothetical protein
MCEKLVYMLCRLKQKSSVLAMDWLNSRHVVHDGSAVAARRRFLS